MVSLKSSMNFGTGAMKKALRFRDNFHYISIIGDFQFRTGFTLTFNIMAILQPPNKDSLKARTYLSPAILYLSAVQQSRSLPTKLIVYISTFTVRFVSSETRPWRGGGELSRNRMAKAIYDLAVASRFRMSEDRYIYPRFLELFPDL